MEQTRVSHHAIVQQFLVTGRRLAISELVIVKLQTNGPRADRRAGNLRAHLDGNSFLRLNVENQIVRRDGIRFIDGKERQRRRLKSKDDAGGALRQSFPGTQIKWDARPTPVLDSQL